MRVRVRIVVAAALAVAPLVTASQTHGTSARGDVAETPRDSVSHLAPQASVPVEDHPRLLLRSEDLPALRARATEDNPVFRGLKGLAEEARKVMDQEEGGIPEEDDGSPGWTEYPTERYAALFAFMSLIGPEADREDYANRAHQLLMHVIDEAAKGAEDGKPFRDPGFATRDRSRWTGEAFGLTVDWIYDRFSEEELAKIRGVFLRWIDENKEANTTTHNHPVPVDVENDPRLLQDPDGEYDKEKVRWSANNYYTAHMRNIGLMGLSFDPDDDPGRLMREAVENATGAWLYVTDHLLRNDMAGGLPAEGFEYGPQTISYVAQFLTALETAGQADPEVWGPQVVIDGNPFWDEVLPAHLASLSPAKKKIAAVPWQAPAFQPSWFGSAQHDWFPDMIGWAAPLALHAERTGASAEAAHLRWLTTHAPVGGAEGLEQRVRTPPSESAFDSMLYFLMLDPTPQGLPVTDPRPAQPLTYRARGMGHTLVRTDHTEQASLFGYTLGWSSINHQSANGNHIELYRNGEWLFKQRPGYDLPYMASDNHNTLSIENVEPDHSEGWRGVLWRKGSQWIEGLANDDGRILAQSAGDGYFYALGDSTALHNSAYEKAEDVRHASRSVVWIEPDVVVTYDRAESKSDNMFKRFWLNLPAVPKVNGATASIETERNRLDVTTLLPLGATPQGVVAVDEADAQPTKPAVGNEMVGKVLVEAPGDPRSARFLTVIDAGDVGSEPDATRLVSSTVGAAYAGARVGEAVVLFPESIAGGASPVTLTGYDVPGSVTQHYVTGLEPGAVYDVAVHDAQGSRRVVIQRAGTAGGSSTVRVVADEGGLLRFSDKSRPTPTPTPTPAPTPTPTDQVAPQTKIVRRPPVRTSLTSARFVVASNEKRSTFECRIDGRRWRRCGPVVRLRDLRVGRHKLAVRAVDAAGNKDATPARVRWIVVVRR